MLRCFPYSKGKKWCQQTINIKYQAIFYLKLIRYHKISCLAAVIVGVLKMMLIKHLHIIKKNDDDDNNILLVD